MTNTKVIKNGEANTNTGFKRLVFTKDLELKPIAYAVHSGFEPNRGTFQVAPEADDYLFFLTWGKVHKAGLALIYKDGIALDNAAYKHVMSAVLIMHPWVAEWLVPQERGGVWIPYSIVPLTQYLSYINKRSQYEAFVNTYGIELDWEEWQISAKDGLHMRPGHDLGDWTNHTPVLRKGPKINTTELFFVSNGDGVSTPITIDPKCTEHDVDYGNSVINTGSPVVFPRGYRFIIRVLKGGYIRNNSSYGISVEIRHNRKAFIKPTLKQTAVAN